MKAFGNLWSKGFGVNRIHCEVAEQVIDEYSRGVDWDWSLLLHPSLLMVVAIMSKSTTSAPGLDGIPNMAWNFAGNQAAVCILDLAADLFPCG